MEISAKLTSVDVILSELETSCFSIFKFSVCRVSTFDHCGYFNFQIAISCV